MATYGATQLQQNRQTITKATAGVVGVLVLLTALGALTVRTGLGLIVVAAAFAGVFWWAFASKRAGNIDNTWVDGWDHDGHTKHMIALGEDVDAPGVPRRGQSHPEHRNQQD